MHMKQFKIIAFLSLLFVFGPAYAENNTIEEKSFSIAELQIDENVSLENIELPVLSVDGLAFHNNTIVRISLDLLPGAEDSWEEPNVCIIHSFQVIAHHDIGAPTLQTKEVEVVDIGNESTEESCKHSDPEDN